MRESGILLPIASLPSRYGIGCFSKEAYTFIDRLKEAGQRCWQILPLGPTGYGDSPYQSFSTFAGNPYFIDLEQLIERGLLTTEECDALDFGQDRRYVDYGKIFASRFRILKKAYRRSGFCTDRLKPGSPRTKEQEHFLVFIGENAFWLDDYALYMAVKDSLGGISFADWENGIRLRRPESMEHYRNRFAEEIRFYQFVQYLFFSQWRRLKAYANDREIKIIGDLPIYVSYDSADTWANPSLFQLDGSLHPVAVAGCPPDAFSATGQLWGNPLYDWDYHRETGYAWWLKRMEQCFRLYDIVRIDHFRGFDEYYSIPWGERTAEHGTWRRGPGFDFFRSLKAALGDVPVIAEDLGFLTDSVARLLEQTGYPGMKVLQFAFDSREAGNYLPCNYDKNCVVYTGTHDNDTIAGWYRGISREDRALSMDYMNNADAPADRIPWDFIRLALGCCANLAVIPMQDYLGLSSEARINTPSTLGINWRWRMLPDEFTSRLAGEIKHLTSLYQRL